MKHTSGPWRISPSQSCIHVISADGSFQTGCLLDNAVANAHLIAAAPDLLAACEAAWASWQEAGEFDAFTIPRMMRAAIAKAHGESEASS